MEYFKDIKNLYEKIFIISKYSSISNSNVNTIVTDMNNIEQVQILIDVTKRMVLMKTIIEIILLIIVIVLIVEIGI